MRLICLESKKHSSDVPKRMLLLMLLLMSGCVSVKLENSERLMRHPGFPAAAQAARAKETKVALTARSKGSVAAITAR